MRKKVRVSFPWLRGIRYTHLSGVRWGRGVRYLLIGTIFIVIALVAVGFHHVYFDRTNLPEIGPFTRFEFPTIGHIYDAKDQPFFELAKEYRRILQYEDIPPIVRDAILATEDKNFFTHGGVDYSVIPRMLRKVRIGSLAARLTGQGRQDTVNRPLIFPQGGSTITQQLVRGYFLQSQTAFQNMTAQENRNHLRKGIFLPRALSLSDRRAKRQHVRSEAGGDPTVPVGPDAGPIRFESPGRGESLPRYASFIYMGNGQYGFATAAEYYFGRTLATFTAEDADKAALLAGIPKSPRVYAPSARETGRIMRRRNQTLALMAANGFIPVDKAKRDGEQPIPASPPNRGKTLKAGAVVHSVLEELNVLGADLGMKDLLEGRIRVYSTVDARVQEIVNEALEHGLGLYEKRHPRVKGLVQGSIVVLRNLDASILAETGGRQFYAGRSATYSDFNRVTKSLRQPGSAMKPIVYLAAFRQGIYTLDTMVPDEPICVPDGGIQRTKWISNYDGQYKGVIPLREALAESRNTVAIWITEQIGIASILRTSRILGVRTTLQPFVTTALGASEVNLLELANAYRTIASGILAQPHVIRRIVRDSGEVAVDNEHGGSQASIDDSALSFIQEGLRGVVRLPTGTAHALASRDFPVAVMGKTGTTSDFRDALFVGSTYGPGGVTVAVRIGFDDNRSLGSRETGGKVALPVFKEIMLRVYRGNLVGPAPEFPARMEESITAYLRGDSPDSAALSRLSMSAIRVFDPWPGSPSRPNGESP